METKEVKGKTEKDWTKKVWQHACNISTFNSWFIVLGWNKKRKNFQRHKMDIGKIKNTKTGKSQGWERINESRSFIFGQLSRW